MAFDIKQGDGTAGQNLTLTLASLGNNSARESTVVDNGTNKFKDVLVTVKVRANSTGVSSTGYVNVYVYGTTDGTNYTANATGSDAAITLTSPPGFELLGSFPVVANSGNYRSSPMSVAKVLGVMPAKWGIIVENRSGAALDSTEGNHDYEYQGKYDTSP